MLLYIFPHCRRLHQSLLHQNSRLLHRISSDWGDTLSYRCLQNGHTQTLLHYHSLVSLKRERDRERGREEERGGRVGRREGGKEGGRACVYTYMYIVLFSVHNIDSGTSMYTHIYTCICTRHVCSPQLGV